ncbi:MULTISPECIES: hypothetical protein [Lactococcus]|uniref:hypothetical protein n=1 Tax=Lactococcus TaxID=1357 RepID=UPI0003ABA190|nr:MULTISPECIES: hypothetical protein [Lactococcus]AGY45828.1 hypothetical protein P620_10855 [Lactococcus lactis subsp. lactis KLDS 4.0325]AGV73775.1 hypothetical protein kw2_1821 [Lactococcus cremoris subsp. cremoris KW2]KHE75826.1 hypothetical protein N489_12645 [Lactococcus lactis subsp. lactis 1AA59]KSU17098.1 hypothetical protein LMG14418_1940 [Lactococcus lactis subsp. lactis]MBG1277793.1 hypothetical protein [Lactococcus lactis subsp. lactis]
MEKNKIDKLLNNIHKLITIDRDYNENSRFIFKTLSEILNGKKIVTKKEIKDRVLEDTKND